MQTNLVSARPSKNERLPIHFPEPVTQKISLPTRQVRTSALTTNATTAMRMVEPKLTFAGDSEAIRSLTENIANAQQKAKAAAEERSSNTKGAAAVCATIGGCIAAIAEWNIHLATGGGSALWVGRVTAGGAAIGGAIGRWIMSTEDPKALMAAAKALSDERGPIVSRLKIGRELHQSIVQLGALARTAATAEALPKEMLERFFSGFTSEYFDVQAAVKETFPVLQTVPGMSAQLKNISAEFFSIGINQLVLDAQVNQPVGKRLLALQRLYVLERELKGSLSVSQNVYNSALSDREPAIRAQALHAMFKEPDLRLKDFKNRVEECLKVQDRSVKEIVLAWLPRFPYRSGSIDIELERLSDPRQNLDSALQKRAAEILRERVDQGISAPLKPEEIARKVANAFVRPPEGFQREIEALVSIYKAELCDTKNSQPNLRIQIKGQYSRYLARKLAKEIFRDSDSYVEVDLAILTSADALRLRLCTAGVLSGKLICLVNLDALDGLTDTKARNNLIEALKPFFNRNDKIAGLDLRDAIIALPLTKPLDEIKALNTEAGRPLRDRITAYSDEVHSPPKLNKRAADSSA